MFQKLPMYYFISSLQRLLRQGYYQFYLGVRRLIYFVQVTRIEHDRGGTDTQVF